MPKQTKSSNTSALRGFVLTLVIIILAVCVMAAMTNGFTNWNPYGWFDDKPADEQQPDGENNAPIDATITNGEHVTLAMSAAIADKETKTVSQQLIATVMPEDAQDKTVDWSVGWASEPVVKDAIVTDYVTVIPQSDGSNVATVTCHKGFEGAEINVVCTTRVGLYTATCTVIYDGKPEEILFVIDNQEYKDGDSIAMTVDQMYDMELKLTNTVGDVGSKYTIEAVTYGASGSFKAEIDGAPDHIITFNRGSMNAVLKGSDLPVAFSVQDAIWEVNKEDAFNYKIKPIHTEKGINASLFDILNMDLEYMVKYTETVSPIVFFIEAKDSCGNTSKITVNLISVAKGVELDNSTITF